MNHFLFKVWAVWTFKSWMILLSSWCLFFSCSNVPKCFLLKWITWLLQLDFGENHCRPSRTAVQVSGLTLQEPLSLSGFAQPPPTRKVCFTYHPYCWFLLSLMENGKIWKPLKIPSWPKVTGNLNSLQWNRKYFDLRKLLMLAQWKTVSFFTLFSPTVICQWLTLMDFHPGGLVVLSWVGWRAHPLSNLQP